MKAICTRYLGPTNTRGARIKAYDEDGNSIVVGYPHHISGNERIHRTAVDALCSKMGWTGRLIGGHIKGGWAFVFVPEAQS